MGLDLRWPIGLMFSLIGALLVIYGFITNSKPELYARSLGLNVNLVWGLVLLVFGSAMLFLAWRGAKKPGEQGPSGQPSSGDEQGARR
jgi:multisubunit Na+/H+ antiporter MnhG subunit